MKSLFLFALLTVSTLAFAAIEKEFSGNLEAQGRHSWNNDLAKKDLFQDWNEEDFYLFYGNLNGKVKFEESTFETNLFARHSHSDLYKERKFPLPPFAAPVIFAFPRKLVARDVFKLDHVDQGDDYRSEYVLNKLYYQWNAGDQRIMLGRMYINYGQGEIFNPINPYNQPTGLTTISQVAQGNDGFNLTFYANDKHTVDFYLLGDKAYDNYEGRIQRTLWVHGEYQVSNNFQLDYVAGEDQNRMKLGGQIRYNFSEAQLFAQTLYQSDYVDDKESHPLMDAMMGYDQQMTNVWHVRAEGGYQKKNRLAGLASINDRFLPSEYFIALANQFEVHPLIKLSLTFINDVKTGFTYFVTKSTFDLGHNTEAEIFANAPIATSRHPDVEAQKLITTDLGLALRTFF